MWASARRNKPAPFSNSVRKAGYWAVGCSILAQATKQKYMRKLERVFHEVDTSGDGLISEDEFRGMMEDSCGTMPSLQNAWQSNLPEP